MEHCTAIKMGIMHIHVHEYVLLNKTVIEVGCKIIHADLNLKISIQKLVKKEIHKMLNCFTLCSFMKEPQWGEEIPW